MPMIARQVLAAADRLAQTAGKLRFAAPVSYVYNPLVYARRNYRAYVERYAAARKEILFLGMNPGPFGMVQCGIPFGAVDVVRDWLGIDQRVDRPNREHPQRPVLGLDCPRLEVSGQRLWGLFAQRFGTADRFFARHWVANYCPLAFLEESGRNRTPDKLPAGERDPLFAACDRHLAEVVAALEVSWVIGVGAFAAQRVREALTAAGLDQVQVGTVLHPSPASPAANRGWAPQAEETLIRLGLWASA